MFFLANPRSCLERYRLAQIRWCKASNLVISGVCFFVSISTDQELGMGYSEHGTCKGCKRIVPKPYSYLKSVQESPEWVTPNSLWMSCGFAKPWIFKYYFKHYFELLCKCIIKPLKMIYFPDRETKNFMEHMYCQWWTTCIYVPC